MNTLKNKTVFITGASSGIGSACAQYFARSGARLILAARRINVLDRLAAELREKEQVEVHTVELDVAQRDQVVAVFQSLPKEWQNIDILINNAGLAAGLDFIQDGQVEDWEEMINTNFKGLIYVTREVLPQMIERNSGHIINIGSIAGRQLYPKGVVYCATKHAVHTFSEGLRLDLFGTKVRVSLIAPGAVETNFSVVRFKGDAERAKGVYRGMDALSAEDIADAVLYCSTRPPHVNVSEMIVMPTDQAAATMIARKEQP